MNETPNSVHLQMSSSAFENQCRKQAADIAVELRKTKHMFIILVHFSIDQRRLKN